MTSTLTPVLPKLTLKPSRSVCSPHTPVPSLSLSGAVPLPSLAIKRRDPLRSSIKTNDDINNKSSLQRKRLLKTAPLVPDGQAMEGDDLMKLTGSARRLPVCRLRMRPSKVARTPTTNTSAGNRLVLAAPFLPRRLDNKPEPKRLDPPSLPACLFFPDIPSSKKDLPRMTGQCPRFALKPRPLKIHQPSSLAA